jgi:outer membrane protein OmpA-like peptidoglycan-associated protein
MTKHGIILVARALCCAAVVSAGLCGCRLLPVTVAAGRPLAAPADRCSVLAVVLDPSSASARAEFMRIVASSARPGEHLIVISASRGTSLGSFAAPPAPRMRGPVLPKALPQHATSFQRANYGKKLALARAVAREDQARLLVRQRRELRSWADRAVLRVLSAASQVRGGDSGLRQAVTEAVADISALQQTGIKLGGRRVIAIVDDEDEAPPRLRASLDGATVVVADVARATQDAAWQADFLEAGASTAFAFTAVTDSRAPVIVSSGLAGRAGFPFELARIRYGAAQYALPASATPALRQALRLLTVTYPTAIASINGYTDAVAVPGGNLKLSWRRAQAVLAWLVDHGVAADRLQAIGHGAADPVAPNGPAGQPLNRRVVLIISRQ